MIKIILLVSACFTLQPHHCAPPEQHWKHWRIKADCYRDEIALLGDLKSQGFDHITMHECIGIDEDLP